MTVAHPDAHCSDCAVRQFTVYAPACAACPEKVEALRKEVRQIAPRRTILRAGEASEEIFTLARGWAFRFVTLPDGGRQILSFLFPGDLIALPLLSSDRLPYSVKTITGVTLCVFPRLKLADYIRSEPDLLANLVDTWVRTGAAADERLRDLGRCPAEQRVARFILALYAQLRDRGDVDGLGFSLPLRQGHIADALGLTTIHVNRVLGDLRRRGLYEISGARLTILDLAGLCHVAELRVLEPVVTQASRLSE